MSPLPAGERRDESNGEDAARKSEKLDPDDRQSEQNPDHRPQPCAGRHPKDVRRDQRVTEKSLICRAGGR